MNGPDRAIDASQRTRKQEEPPDATTAGEAARAQLLAALPVSERRMRLAGVSTAVLEGGQGPPLVLLHGPGGYAAHWMRVIPGLIASHRVVAPDLPGHGASEVLGGQLDAEGALAWLGALIEQTCSAPPAVVGALLGGAIAARFAARDGERVSRLVLVDSLGLTRFQPAAEFAVALNQFHLQPTDETHANLWRYCAHDLDRLRREMGKHWEPFALYNLDRARSPSAKATQAVLMNDFGMPELAPEELARIAVPTALIWGRHDLATPLAVAEAVSARRGWPLHVIDNASDDPAIEEPAAFLRVLTALLSHGQEEEAE